MKKSNKAESKKVTDATVTYDEAVQEEHSNPDAPPKPPVFSRKTKILFSLFQIISIVFWTYAILTIFVTDLDAYFLSWDSSILTFLITYKFLVLIGTFALIWLFVRNLTVLSFVLYVPFYPLLLLGWKIPKLLWKAKSPLVTLSFLNIIISFFRSVKYLFISSSFLLIFSAIILIGQTPSLIYFSCFALLVLLVIIYIHRFLIILRPSAIYQVHARIATAVISTGLKSLKEEESLRNRPLETLSKSERQTWTTSLQSLVIGNHAALFLSSKLSDYQKSNVKIIFYVGNLFILILITTFVFAVIGLGLYKVDPSNFQVSADPSFFMFIYYSISNVFARSISEIAPHTDIARVFSIIQLVFSFVLLAIILTLIFSLQNQTDSEQIDKAIKDIKEQGGLMEKFIRSEYKLTTSQAILELEKGKAIFIKLIYYFATNAEGKVSE